LSPSAIARAHGLSVRTINRAFNATGQTVGETIRIRRLARARNELAERRQPIGTFATKWGFDDSSHFSRSFKACYGTSPKEFRDARVRAEQAGAAMQQTGPRVQALTDASDKTGVTPARW
jgi:AraC family transcriptional regulator, positive regulator of tynA and feaB